MYKQNDSALKEEVRPFATPWMTLDDPVLSGVRMISLTGGFKTEVELIEPEPRVVIAGQWWGNGGFWPKGTRLVLSPGDLTYSMVSLKGAKRVDLRSHHTYTKVTNRVGHWRCQLPHGGDHFTTYMDISSSPCIS